MSTAKPGRLGYLDWLRGVTVLIMIEAHAFDAWTLPTERTRPGFGRLMLLAGMAAPLFLFLAGVAVSLAGAAQLRRGRTIGEASGRVQHRGWQIFGYAFLFRLQSYVLGGFPALRGLLKVDILNVMGPAIAATAALWGCGRRRTTRAVWLVGATVAVLIATPWLRGLSALGQLPNPIEWYFRPPPGQGTFTFLPWSAFVLAGGVLGLAIDGASERAAWTGWRLQGAVAAAGAMLLGGGIWGASQPRLLPGAEFWTTSPTFFSIRLGLMLLMVAAAWLWSARPWRSVARTSPLEVLGVGSLFVYWIHVELVYGVASRAIRHQLTLEQCAIAWAGFSLAMYALLLGWNRSRPTRGWLKDRAIKSLKSNTWREAAAAGR